MKNLKLIRKSRGYSQAQIAQFLHIGSSTVCRWELGHTKPALCQFLKLCKILNCQPAQLCDNIKPNELPVFDTENALITGHSLTYEIKNNGCSFGVVLPFDISSRLKKGDICYFSFEDTADCEDSLVLAFDDNYNEYLYPFKDHNSQLQIIATCKIMHTKIQ